MYHSAARKTNAGSQNGEKNQKLVVKACVITCPESQQYTQINNPFYESGEVTLETHIANGPFNSHSPDRRARL
jgi:hypothetical protein